MSLNSFLPNALLCTLNANSNRQSVLETYALFKVIKEFGYKPVVDDGLLREESINLDYLRKYSITASKVFQLNDYNLYGKKFPYLICGTSNGWEDIDAIEHTFLNFGDENVKRIAYAPTFGDKKQIPLGPKNAMYFMMDRIERKAVADTCTLRILELEFRKSADFVCNPMLLIEDYPTDAVKEDGLYILADIHNRNQQKQRYYEIAEEALKYRIEDVSPDLTRKTLEEYIASIKKAAFVYTDSLDSVCMALVFQKPFVVIVSKKDVGKIDFLIKIGLEERIVYVEEDLKEKKYLCRKPVKYHVVDKEINRFRDESIQWLKESLGEVVE